MHASKLTSILLTAKGCLEEETGMENKGETVWGVEPLHPITASFKLLKRGVLLFIRSNSTKRESNLDSVFNFVRESFILLGITNRLRLRRLVHKTVGFLQWRIADMYLKSLLVFQININFKSYFLSQMKKITETKLKLYFFIFYGKNWF